MNLLKDPIEVLERLDYRPKRAEVPTSIYPLQVTLGDLYGYALDLEEPDECDWQLRWLVIHNLHHRWIQTEEGQRGMTLCEAFAEERTGIWFYALARDVRVGCYRVIEVARFLAGETVGIKQGQYRTEQFQLWRRRAQQLYGCIDPVGTSKSVTRRVEAVPVTAPRVRSYTLHRQPTKQAELFDK